MKKPFIKSQEVLIKKMLALPKNKQVSLLAESTQEVFQVIAREKDGGDLSAYLNQPKLTEKVVIRLNKRYASLSSLSENRPYDDCEKLQAKMENLKMNRLIDFFLKKLHHSYFSDGQLIEITKAMLGKKRMLLSLESRKKGLLAKLLEISGRFVHDVPAEGMDFYFDNVKGKLYQRYEHGYKFMEAIWRSADMTWRILKLIDFRTYEKILMLAYIDSIGTLEDETTLEILFPAIDREGTLDEKFMKRMAEEFPKEKIEMLLELEIKLIVATGEDNDWYYLLENLEDAYVHHLLEKFDVLQRLVSQGRMEKLFPSRTQSILQKLENGKDADVKSNELPELLRATFELEQA